MFPSQIGVITIMLRSASTAYGISSFSNTTTTSLSASSTLQSSSNTVLPGSSYSSESLSSISSTSGSSLPGSSLSLSPTTNVPGPSSLSSSLASGFYLSGETLTETITRELIVTTTETYDNDWGTPTLTVTGPFTSTETKTVTTQVIASYQNNATNSALPPWDRNPYLDYFQYPYPSVNASFASVLSSFVAYGRQPQCTAAYSAYIATAPLSTETDPVAIITTTLPGNHVTESIFYETLTQAPLFDDAYCCWYCSLFYTNVQVFYWPATDANTACLNSVASSTVMMADGTSAAQKRNPDPTQLGTEVYATGPDGFVYTSPSVYVAFPTVSGLDECGLVGPPITALTLAFAPGELSTITDQNPGPVPGSTVAFNPADLPCGPINGTNGFLPNPVNVSSYLPIIALPSKLLAYRPEWASLNCVNDIWEGQDPPYALIPQSQVMPASTPALSVTNDPPVPETTPAVPASTFASPASSTAVMQLTTASQLLPAQSPSSSPLIDLPPSPSPVPSIISSAGQAEGSPNNDPGVSSTYNNVQSTGPLPVVVGGQSPSLTAAIPPASPTIVQPQQSPSPIVVGGFTFTPAPAVTSAPVASAQPVSASAISIDGQGFTPVPGSSGAIVFNGQTLTQGQGATTINNIPIVLSSGSIFINGQGTAIPTAPTANSFDLNSPAPPVVAGKTVSIINPSTIVWGSQTLTLGQPAATISGIPVALASAGLIIEGSLTIPLASLAPPMTMTSAPSSPGALQVDGTTLIPGGPAVTISGTRLSLGVSSNLIVGTSTIYLPAPTSYIVVASETIDLASSDVVVGGKTLTPGSPAVTVNGVLVSLGSSVLVVGSTTKTFAIAGSTATTTGGGIGAAIISAFGGVGVGTLSPLAPTTTGNGTGVFGINPFEGAAKGRGGFDFWIGGLAVLSSLLFGSGIRV
ncbi:hypothetical protein MMC11_007476 [Xylographa trunciseda]|nr:hypothetical protein [Xylographa trunciseda]